jgi:phosphatidate phosphatase PAH1
MNMAKTNVDRSKLIRDLSEKLPTLKVKYELLTDEQIIILLLNEELKTINLSYQQIQIKYSVSQAIARKLKFIVVNCVAKV